MAESIRINEGWRRKALTDGLTSILFQDTGLTPDSAALQGAFEAVCGECRDMLPCGSTLAVASGKTLEERARWDFGLDREEFRLAVRCLRESGVLERLPRVSSQRNGALIGVPAEYGALEAYDFAAHEGTLEVSRRGMPYPRVVGIFGVPGGVDGCRRWVDTDWRWTHYRVRCEAEVRALYGLGLHVAPALVYAYGPTRCRQVREWAARRTGRRVSAGLVFSTITKYPPDGDEATFDADAIRKRMSREIAFDENRRSGHTA